MKRRVIQLAGKTLVISLPLKWAREHNIKKGDELELELGNNQLNITTSKRKLQLETSLFLDCNEEFARRRINTLYKRGIDQISVSVKKANLLAHVRDEVRTLMGFEIVDMRELGCTIKNIAHPLDSELNVIIRRVFLINLEMTKVIERLLQKKSEEHLNELKSLEEMNDKLTNFCKRILNKQVNNNMSKTNLTYCLLWGLEKLGDEYEKLGLQIYNNKISREMIKIIASINFFYRCFYELYSKFDEKKASKFSEEYLVLKSKLLVFLKKNPLVGHYALNIVQGIHELAGPYYATIL